MRPIQRIFAHAVSSSFQMRVRFRRAKILDNVANVGKRTIPVPAVFNHEPGATTSRIARLTRSSLPLAQSLSALACAIVVRANPVLAGLCRRARHESAQARHENLYPLSSMARKCCRGFIERACRHEGLVDQNASGLLDNPIVFVECSRCGQRFSSTTSDCRLNVRGRFEEFSRIDGRLESFRVARNARFRDRDAGIPPAGAGAGRVPPSRAKAAGGFESSNSGTRPNRACAMPATLVRG